MPVVPMMRLLHRYPLMMDAMQCDKGAIKHIFSGSHVMAPGIISPGGKLYPGLDVLAPVQVTAEGKEHAMAIGVLAMSSDEIAKTKKGEAIQVI